MASATRRLNFSRSIRSDVPAGTFRSIERLGGGLFTEDAADPGPPAGDLEPAVALQADAEAVRCAPRDAAGADHVPQRTPGPTIPFGDLADRIAGMGFEWGVSDGT